MSLRHASLLNRVVIGQTETYSLKYSYMCSTICSLARALNPSSILNPLTKPFSNSNQNSSILNPLTKLFTNSNQIHIITSWFFLLPSNFSFSTLIYVKLQSINQFPEFPISLFLLQYFASHATFML